MAHLLKAKQGSISTDARNYSHLLEGTQTSMKILHNLLGISKDNMNSLDNANLAIAMAVWKTSDCYIVPIALQTLQASRKCYFWEGIWCQHCKGLDGIDRVSEALSYIAS